MDPDNLERVVKRSRLRVRSKSLNFIDEIYSNGKISRQERLLRINSQIRSSEISKLCWKKRSTLLSLSFVNFMSFCSMSIMAPFFPKKAHSKGLSDTLSGFIFSFHALVMFLTSPIFGKIIPKIGAKFLFLSGIFLAGYSSILFGTLEYVNDYSWFVGLCFAIRGFEALGASAFSIATNVLVIRCFPEHMGTILGILETFVGLGMSAGPAIGGFLYELGGFEMPFYVLGISMIAVIPLNYFLLPSIEDVSVNTQKESTFRLIKIPSVMVTCCVVTVVSSSWGFLDPTLEPHLRNFGLQPKTIGLIFLMFSSLYAIFSPFWGWICDKFQNYWLMISAGLFLNSVSLMFAGPCPFIPGLKSSIWINLLSLSGMGISVALALIPTFQCILQGALSTRFSDSLNTYSIVAGIWSSIYSLGEVIGPSLGGILVQNYGFPIAATFMAIMNLVVLLLVIVFSLFKRKKPTESDNCSDSGISGSWKSDYSEECPLLNRNSENNKLYIQEKVLNCEQSRKHDFFIGEIDQDQPTDFRGTISITQMGSCEA